MILISNALLDRTVDRESMNLYAKSCPCHFCRLYIRQSGTHFRTITEHSYSRDVRKNLLEELQPLWSQSYTEDTYTGDVPAGAREVRN